MDAPRLAGLSADEKRALLAKLLERKARAAKSSTSIGEPPSNVAQTPLEQKLAAIFAELLQIPRPGRHDSFVELGGHSLLASQLLTRVHSEFGVLVPIERFFAAPTLAELASAIEEGQKPNGLAGLSSVPMRPVPRDQPLPLSLGQETLWFLDQLEPGNATYNCPAVLRASGKLDFEITRRAFEAVVHRHEALRSTFQLRDDVRIVEIQPPGPLPFPVIDLTDLPIEEREAKAQELGDCEGRKPFDLARGPLIRLSALRLGEDEHIILMTVHHIVYDGWSTGVLVHEFVSNYRAIAEGRPIAHPQLPIQYADFAAWQRRCLEEGLLDGQLEFWKKQLRGVPPLLALPTDRPRPQVWSFRGATVPIHFPPELLAELRSVSKANGVTLFMTLLAAFQTLLHRYAGQDDICVGSPIANRNRPEMEGLIGFVVNTLVLRGDLSGNPTFRELLSRTRATALAAYSHQDVPFERVMQAVNPNRDVRHSSLFQVLFVLQNAAVRLPPLPGVESKFQFDVHNGTSKFDLTLGLTETAEGLVGILEYNTDLFDASTVERMAKHLHRLLEEVSRDPNRPIDDLPLLSETERSAIVAYGLGDRVLGNAGRCLHELFELAVDNRPDSEVVWGDVRLTYRELNRQANQLARHLQQRGVGPDTLVGLCLERSIEMIIGVLATLKAGGAYVPLDPALPRERLATVLTDCKPALVLTQKRLAADLPVDSDRVEVLDAPNPVWQSQSDGNPQSGVTPHNLAYVIYTSGSTGTPKGCMIEHRSVVNTFDGWEAAYHLSSLKSYLLMANFAFDVCTGDMFRALGSGGKLVLCPTETLLDPERLLALIRREAIEYVEVVPAVMRPILRHLEVTGEDLRPVKLVVCGSDVWYGGEFRRLRRALGPHTALMNSYGLTEAAIDNAYFDGDDSHLADDGPIPIGRPYANQQLVVLDPRGQIQLIGVPGELHAGGPGLARGYLNAPDLTAEKFLSNPERPGERLYKSGDLARVLPNGDFELLGRTDNQVKVRGFRIELGEIEATLAQHPGVRDAAVVAREDVRGFKRLVAYVVPREDGPAASATDLRAFLGGKLPDYMVPTIFVPLAEMPITSNGKVDRKALPTPDLNRPDVAHEYVAPQTPVEEKLASIWADVLRIERVGSRDSFFELGGHSLVATQVLSRVRAEFGVELPLRKLFESPVLAEFGRAVEAAERSKQGPSLVRTEGDEVPLSFGQQRLWFLDRLEPGNSAYHLSAAVRLTGELDTARLQWCLDSINARHDLLRTSFPAPDGKPTAVVSPATSVIVPITDLSGLPIAEREPRVRALAQEHYRRPFDMERGPLYRVHLLRLAEREHVALVTMHHIISDGWSIGVFLRELGQLYVLESNGRREPLPPLPIQYADYTRWQHDWLKGDVHRQHLEFWTKHIGDAPQILDLPTDRPRPPLLSTRGAARTRTLRPELAEAVRHFSQREGVTTFMTMLAAFHALLSRYSGQNDLLIGTPVANRNRVELEGLIGFFVNTLVLRGDLRGDPTFREFVGRVREDALQAFAHQELPFEHLVEALKPQRDPSRTPLFQVMFSDETAQASLSLPGLSLQTVPLERGTAMFDLTLTVADDGGDLVVSAEYNSDLFDESTITRLLRHYESLIGQLTAHPDGRVSAAQIADAAERWLVLNERNVTELEYARDKSIHTLIAERAKQMPEAIAAIYGDESLTYAQLNAQADRLAFQLRQIGIGRESIVGLCVARSIEMAIGLLGILKAGAAYLPLDPDYPAERLQFMLEDAGAQAVLTQQSLRTNLPPWIGPVHNIADLLATESAAFGDDDRGSESSADDAAYVIYTSGSSGTPKGVVVTHRNLANLCAGVQQMLGLHSSDRILQFTSLSFDVAVEEIFPAWSVGAAVVMRPVGPPPSVSELLQFTQRHRLTILELPTAYWHELASELAVEPRPLPPSLRIVVAGGERARPDMASAWQKGPGQTVHWINAYGPTETTVTSIAFAAPLGTALPSGDVPIGQPLANVRAYVLDGAGQPQPVGVPGELYIGGDCVARGYLNRPELTAKRFVADPFHGGRMYQTGDRARWRSDGQLEFLGRVDDQIKIRGFRIEPGEVETVLARHPALRHTAVLARADQSGQMQLAAYFALAPGEDSTSTTDLIEYLRKHLPEYMLPTAWVALPELPLTSGGKIDRRALPAPSVIAGARQHVAPRTPEEQQVADIWQELFGIDRVGATDNFFDLGGNSLMAVQLAARMSRSFGREVSVRSILFFPTVAALAEAVMNQTAASTAVVGDGRSAAAWIDELGPFVTVERESVEDRIVAGDLPPVQAAAIGYLPTALLAATGLDANDVIHEWCDNRPVVTGVIESQMGRIASILIPRFDTQLYDNRDELVAVLGDAFAVAGKLGAKTVSLTGLLPSATDYGRLLDRAFAGTDLPLPTTGHAATTATVVMAIRRLLRETGRDLSRERVAFLGLGSIGTSVLRLMLRQLPHPAEIRLCDVYSKHDSLHELRDEIRALGYRGAIHISEARGAAPDEVYEATFVIGATNAPDILDVNRLQPGTLIVDDSAPHCFRPDKAIARLRDRGDILFTEGGTLSAPQPIQQTVFLPPALEVIARAVPRDLLPLVNDPHQITGCIVSSLLGTHDQDLKPTTGLVDDADSVAHFNALAELQFDAAPLHCESLSIDPELIAAFRDRFGGAVTLSQVEAHPAEATSTAMPTQGIDWRKETAIAPEISATGLPAASMNPPSTILLTGATGFLGAFLLDELLRQSSAQVICLARAADDAEAGRRIRANLEQYGLGSIRRFDRIIPCAGDLAEPMLGVCATRWAELTQSVDAIVHSGALVHFLHPYGALKSANVQGTCEVLRLATTGRLKAVHYISTLSVAAPTNGAKFERVDRREISPEHLENGYEQSKWVAEQLIWQAMERGVPATIFRPGRIVWHSKTGAVSSRDLLARAIRTCIELRAVPSIETNLEMTPVDYVCRAIAAICLKPGSTGQAYHLFNRRMVHLRDLRDWIRAAGYPMQSVSMDQWLNRLQEVAEQDSDDGLPVLLPLMTQDSSPLAGERAGPPIDDRNTQEQLLGTGIACPAIGADVVAVFVANLMSANSPAQAQAMSGRLTSGRRNSFARPRRQDTK